MSYLMGATGPVYRTDEDGRLNWYVADGLGSTVAEVDGQGGVYPGVRRLRAGQGVLDAGPAGAGAALVERFATDIA